MFKTLLLCGLLSVSSGFKLNDVQNINNSINSDCDSVSSVFINRTLEPKKLATNYQLTGLYNFKDTFDVTFIEDGSLSNDSGNFNIYFDNEMISTCPYYWKTNYGGAIRYLKSLNIDYDFDSSWNIDLTFTYFLENEDSTSTFNFLLELDDWRSLDLHYSDTIKYFYFNNRNISIIDNEDCLIVFNNIFTNIPNSYHHVLNGYYTLNNLPNGVNVIGFSSVIFNNNLYYDFQFLDSSASKISLHNWDIVDNRYGATTYDFPFQSDVVAQPFFYFTGTWTTSVDYNLMTGLGVFGYVPSLNQSDFKDLLFTIADTPIYFLSSLFSFELFGVNMFVAFTSLLTLIVIIVLIRKFF